MKKSLSISLSNEDLSLDACSFYRKFEAQFHEAFGWVDATKASYAKYIELLSDALNGIPLNEATGDTFDAAIRSVNDHKKKKYAENTLRTIRSIINDICYFAEVYSHGSYHNALWGTTWHAEVNLGSPSSLRVHKSIPVEKQISDKLAIPKSLTLSEEIKLSKMIRYDSAVDSCLAGLAIMFYLGLRPGECVGLTFGCIRPLQGHPGVNCLYISSQIRGAGEQTNALKTENAYRVLPIPAELDVILQRRKNYLAKKFEDVSHLPIVCANETNGITEPCRPKLFMEYCKNALRSVKVKESVLLGMAQEAKSNGREESAATSYLLRRHLATVLLGVCSMEADEVKFILGHAIPTLDESRRDYLNPDTLFRLWKKLNIRSFYSKYEFKFSVKESKLNLHQKAATLIISPEYAAKHPSGVLIHVHNSDANDHINLIVTEGKYSDIQMLVAPRPAEQRRAPRIQIGAEFREAIDKSIKLSESHTKK